MKRLLLSLALLLLCAPAFAYTAYPTLTAGAGNTGLTTGSLIGYTVLGTDAVTVITTRTTIGIVEIGNGNYAVPAGITVPDGSTYFVKWDRSDTSVILGAAPTQANSLGSGIKAKTDLLATNAADSPNAVTAQTNSATAATQATTAATQATSAATASTSNGTQIAALPTASANGTAAANAILSTPGNKLGTNSSGQVVAASVAGAVGSVTGAVGSVTAGVQVASYATHEDPAYLVLDTAASGHTTAGTVGQSISAAGSAGNPWTTDVSTGYTGTQAGALLFNNLNASVSSRLPSTSYAAAPTTSQIAAALLTNPTYPLANNASGQIIAASVAGNVAGSVGSVTGSVGSVTAPVTATVNSPVQVGSYAAGQDPGTYVLSVPAQKVVTNSFGYVTTANPATGSGSDPLTNTTATYATPGTVGYVIAHNLDSNVGGVPAATVTAIKADSAFTKLLAHNLGKFTYNPTTKTLTLLQDDGVTVLGTVTITTDTAGANVISHL